MPRLKESYGIVTPDDTSMSYRLASQLWRASPAALAERISAGRWRRAPHLTLLSLYLADIAFGDKRRLLVSMPPRHGKSLLCSFWFPIWYLTIFPENRIILTSYEADFARSWGRKVRDAINEHSSTLRIKLSATAAAANYWELDAGGGMMTAGVGGPITGKGANLLLIDDPIKNHAEAYSETYRKKTWDWWLSTARTRIEPGGSAVVVMTRWHEDDIVGRLKNEMELGGEQWDELKFPAIAEENDVLGRSPGDALWPARYSAETLLELKPGNSIVWNGLYQQRPAPSEGNLVKRDWIKYYDTPPKRFDEMLQSWDLAFEGGLQNDYVVGQVWGRLGADCYLLDQIRSQIDFPDTLRAFEALTLRWPKARKKLVENKANGAALISTLARKIQGIVPVNPEGSKEARLVGVSPVFESGNVWIPSPKLVSWVKAWVEEIVTFPGAANDDQVDGATQALARLANSALERLRRLATM
jgi:predicted phage terminase large subunit-like protein